MNHDDGGGGGGGGDVQLLLGLPLHPRESEKGVLFVLALNVRPREHS